MAARKLLRSFSSMSIKSPSSSSFYSSSTSRLRPTYALNPGLGSPISHFSSDEPPSSPPSSPGFDPTKKPPKLPGCDYKHWFVVVNKPIVGGETPEIIRQNTITEYIRILAAVVGSEEVAREKMYSVSTQHYFAFGALLSEELAHKLRDVANVRFVLPDSYVDAENQDYGGEPLIEGKAAAPYDKKYHVAWKDRQFERKLYHIWLNQEKQQQHPQQQRPQQYQQRGPQHVTSPVGQFGHGQGTNQQHVGSPQVETRQFGRGRGPNQQHVGSPPGENSWSATDQFGRGTNQFENNGNSRKQDY